MTDEERYIVQGRTRDAAKKLKVEIATLRAFFEEYAELLDALQGAIKHFLAEPSSKVADGRILIDHLNQLQRKLSEAGFFDHSAEYMEKSRKLRDLEEQIKHFE